MSRRDDFRNYSFSEAELYAACHHYVGRMLASVEALPLDFEPSASHRDAIRRLIDRSLRKGKRHAFYRHMAAAAAVIILFFSTVMATNIHARETVVRWLRQVFPDHVLYRFFGEPNDGFYRYTINWVPNGFELVEHEENSWENYYIYMSGSDGIIIDFFDLGHWDELALLGYTDYTLTDTTVNGLETVIYQDNDSENIDVVVFDLAHDMVICVNSNIDLDLVMEVIRSIK